MLVWNAFNTPKILYIIGLKELIHSCLKFEDQMYKSFRLWWIPNLCQSSRTNNIFNPNFSRGLIVFTLWSPIWNCFVGVIEVWNVISPFLAGLFEIFQGCIDIDLSVHMDDSHFEVVFHHGGMFERNVSL